MNNIKVLIVEDKSLISQSVKVLLEKHGMTVVGIFSKGEEAIDSLQALDPDLVLMDIELAGAMDGISTAQVIMKQNPLPIIYLTDFKDDKTVQRSKQTYPANYLTKPFNEADLIRAIDLAFNNANQSPQLRKSHQSFVFVREDTQVYTKINLEEIVYLEADRAYCNLVMVGGRRKLTTSMNKVLEQVKSPDLERVHRSYVVNLKKVTGIDGNTIKLGEYEVQMGKEYRDDFMEKIKVIR